jgi:hypothetical protein
LFNAATTVLESGAADEFDALDWALAAAAAMTGPELLGGATLGAAAGV